MAKNIYEELNDSTNCSVAAIFDKHGIVGRVITRHSKSNATVFAYVHFYGTEMVKGKASGGGYDRTSAAIANAAEKYLKTKPDLEGQECSFWNAMTQENDQNWETALRDVGMRTSFIL